MVYVFELRHFKITQDDEDYIDDDCDPKSIGIFSGREKAEAAMRMLRDKPGFRDWPGGFRIFRSVLDQPEWTDGFVDAFEDTPSDTNGTGK